MHSAPCDPTTEVMRPTPAVATGLFHRMLAGLCWYYLSLMPLIGIAFSGAVIQRKPHPHSNPPGFFSSMANWDGVWYERIVNTGYFYDPGKHSSIAFFPGFPLLARLVQIITGLDAVMALLFVSHACYLLLFVAVPIYLHDRDNSGDWGENTILALLFWPMAIFFRFAYSESLFVLLMVLVLMGNRRQWPLVVVAAIAGTATGVRSVGVVLAVLVVWRCLHESGSIGLRVVRGIGYGCLSAWGLLAFMAFQWKYFADPFVFCWTQTHWTVMPSLSLWQTLESQVLLEPIWSVYVPSHPAFWARFEWQPNILVGLQFWNPLFLVASAGFVAIGIRRRWLTTEEVLLSVGLLLIPYLLQGYRMAMMGQGRFAGAVFPCYIVMGRLLGQLPPAPRAALCATAACFSTVLMAMFAAWYRVF